MPTAPKAHSRLLALTLCVPASAPLAPAETIVLWTFESSVPTSSGPHAAEAGSGTASGLHADPAAVFSNPAGNGSAEAFSANRWAIGDYFEFRLSTTDYQDLRLSWDQARSSTGPATFDLAYSTDGIDFTVALDDYLVSSSSFNGTSYRDVFTRSVDLSHNSVINNAAGVWFRLIASAPAGGTTGASRIDNFLVEGSPYVPALYWSPPAGGTSAVWDSAAANWITNPLNPAARTPYSSGYEAVFGANGVTAEALTVEIPVTGVTASAGIRFDADGYVVRGGALTLASTNVKVDVAGEATIASSLAGSDGIHKIGEGKLILDGVNTFTGSIRIDGGSLSIAADSALGAPMNPVKLNNGGLLLRGNVDLGTREITGQGSITVEAGGRLTTRGIIDVEHLTLAGGEFQLEGLDVRMETAVISAPARLRVPDGLRIGSGGIAVRHDHGTTNFEGGLDLEGATRKVDVADGSADRDLVMTGSYSSTSGGGQYKLHKLGPGTLDLRAEGLGSSGLRIGTSGSSGTAVEGGRVVIKDANALGGGALDFNYGVLEIAGVEGAPTPSLTGAASALVDISLGGVEGGGGAEIRGGAIEFLGDVRLYKPSGATVNHTLALHNHTIISGMLRQTTNPASGTFSGLRLTGAGTLSLRGTANDFSDAIVVDGPTLEVDGMLAASRVDVLKGTLAGTTYPGITGIQGSLTIGDSLPGDAMLSPGPAVFREGLESEVGTLMLKSVDLLSDAILKIDLNSEFATSDQVILTDGGLTIHAGARLALSDFGSRTLMEGAELTIIEIPFGLPVIGRFDQTAWSTGSNFFEVSYDGGDGNDVVLRVIPEPRASILLTCGALLMPLRLYRRGRGRREVSAPRALDPL